MNSSVTNSHHDLHNYDAPCQGPSNRNDLPVQPCRCRAAERPETSRGRELVFLGGAAGRYSVSEWWFEPRTRGPAVHAHPEDHVFYVIAGTLSLRVNDDWSHVTMSRRLRSRRLFSHRACCETRAKNPSAEARRWGSAAPFATARPASAARIRPISQANMLA